MRAVRLASRLVRQVQAEMLAGVITKGDLSPVTVADYASQALIAGLLEQVFPQDALVAEEDSSALRQADGAPALEEVTRFVRRFDRRATPERVCAWIDRGASQPARRFWTLDPIDGTKGFLRGDQYAIALALIEEDRAQLGTLGCPNLAQGYRMELGGPGTLAIAVRGEGAWWQPLEGEGPLAGLQVSRCADPPRARLLRSFESGHTNVGQIDRFSEALGVQATPVRMDSQAKYAVLAAGGGEIYLRMLSPEKPHYREKIWDQVAGSLLVEEAGGRVSDLSGAPLDFAAGRTLVRNRGVLATNGLLHDAALETLHAIGA